MGGGDVLATVPVGGKEEGPGIPPRGCKWQQQQRLPLTTTFPPLLLLLSHLPPLPSPESWPLRLPHPPPSAAAPTSPALSSWPCAALRCCLVRSPPLPCLPFYPTPWLWGPMTACPSRRPRLSSPWTLPRRHSRCIQRRYVCGGACRVHVGQVEGDSLTLRGALGWLAGGTWHAPTWHALT